MLLFIWTLGFLILNPNGRFVALTIFADCINGIAEDNVIDIVKILKTT
jgi:hypothetical protein